MICNAWEFTCVVNNISLLCDKWVVTRRLKTIFGASIIVYLIIVISSSYSTLFIAFRLPNITILSHFCSALSNLSSIRKSILYSAKFVTSYMKSTDEESRRLPPTSRSPVPQTGNSGKSRLTRQEDLQRVKMWNEWWVKRQGVRRG